MKSNNKPHQHYCGIDLHARSMYACILNQEGEVVLHKKMPAGPEPFLRVINPFREGLVVAVECIFTWYWLADLLTHIQNTNSQCNLPEFGRRTTHKLNFDLWQLVANCLPLGLSTRISHTSPARTVGRASPCPP